MEEPTRYKKDSMRNAKIPYWLIFKRYYRGLIALCITWFIYDFITYPVSVAFQILYLLFLEMFLSTVRHFRLLDYRSVSGSLVDQLKC